MGPAIITNYKDGKAVSWRYAHKQTLHPISTHPIFKEMTIHTDTFPLVCQQAANSPVLQLRCRVVENVMQVYLENRHVFSEHSFESMPVQVDITPLLAKGSIEALAKKDQPVSINLVDNKTFKHLLERLDKKDPVIL